MAGKAKGIVAGGEEWARDAGCTEFASDTRFENRMSVRAHLACGFEGVGTGWCFRKS